MRMRLPFRTASSKQQSKGRPRDDPMAAPEAYRSMPSSIRHAGSNHTTARVGSRPPATQVIRTSPRKPRFLLVFVGGRTRSHYNGNQAVKQQPQPPVPEIIAHTLVHAHAAQPFFRSIPKRPIFACHRPAPRNTAEGRSEGDDDGQGLLNGTVGQVQHDRRTQREQGGYPG